MRKITTLIIAFALTATLLLGFSVASFAETKNKADIKNGDKVDVVSYDVATGEYAYGTMVVKKHNPSGYKFSYYVLNEHTFKETDGTITDTIKNKIQLLQEKTNIVFTERASEVDLSRFGRVDSEAAPYSITISPYVVPLLEQAGFAQDKNIWLVWGDGAGTVTKVWLSVCEDDLAAKPVTPVEPPEPTEPEEPTEPGKTVSLSVITPKKMVIRLENGTVLSNGDSFNIEIGKTVRFQMCSVNWDNNTYDDAGNGIAGTVVYSVTVSNSYTERSYDAASKAFVIPKGDLVLRTDVNKCFMAYKYHFLKGDYNKQTGIVNVINTPLESLSVNLPLGSTIKSDAYNAYNQIDTAYVFIENDADMTLSYTDYNWNY